MTIAFDADLDSSPPRSNRRLLGAVAICVLAVMLAVGTRSHLVRVAPRTAVLFEAAGLPINLTGLALERVTARVVADGDRRLLVVEGEIVNSTDKDEIAKPLSVLVRGERNEPLYSWMTRAPQQKVAAGERAAFMARLASPPAAGANVVVEFDRSEPGSGSASGKKRETSTRVQGSKTESQ